MSAGTGFPTRFPGNREAGESALVKRIRIRPGVTQLLDEREVEALHQECEAALRAWDEQRAQELHELMEAESADSADPMNN